MDLNEYTLEESTPIIVKLLNDVSFNDSNAFLFDFQGEQWMGTNLGQENFFLGPKGTSSLYAERKSQVEGISVSRLRPRLAEISSHELGIKHIHFNFSGVYMLNKHKKEKTTYAFAYDVNLKQSNAQEILRPTLSFALYKNHQTAYNQALETLEVFDFDGEGAKKELNTILKDLRNNIHPVKSVHVQRKLNTQGKKILDAFINLGHRAQLYIIARNLAAKFTHPNFVQALKAHFNISNFGDVYRVNDQEALAYKEANQLEDLETFESAPQVAHLAQPEVDTVSHAQPEKNIPILTRALLASNIELDCEEELYPYGFDFAMFERSLPEIEALLTKEEEKIDEHTLGAQQSHLSWLLQAETPDLVSRYLRTSHRKILAYEKENTEVLPFSFTIELYRHPTPNVATEINVEQLANYKNIKHALVVRHAATKLPALVKFFTFCDFSGSVLKKHIVEPLARYLGKSTKELFFAITYGLATKELMLSYLEEGLNIIQPQVGVDRLTNKLIIDNMEQLVTNEEKTHDGFIKYANLEQAQDATNYYRYCSGSLALETYFANRPRLAKRVKQVNTLAEKELTYYLLYCPSFRQLLMLDNIKQASGLKQALDNRDVSTAEKFPQAARTFLDRIEVPVTSSAHDENTNNALDVDNTNNPNNSEYVINFERVGLNSFTIATTVLVSTFSIPTPEVLRVYNSYFNDKLFLTPSEVLLPLNENRPNNGAEFVGKIISNTFLGRNFDYKIAEKAENARQLFDDMELLILIMQNALSYLNNFPLTENPLRRFHLIEDYEHKEMLKATQSEQYTRQPLQNPQFETNFDTDNEEDTHEDYSILSAEEIDDAVEYALSQYHAQEAQSRELLAEEERATLEQVVADHKVASEQENAGELVTDSVTEALALAQETVQSKVAESAAQEEISIDALAEENPEISSKRQPSTSSLGEEVEDAKVAEAQSFIEDSIAKEENLGFNKESKADSKEETADTEVEDKEVDPNSRRLLSLLEQISEDQLDGLSREEFNARIAKQLQKAYTTPALHPDVQELCNQIYFDKDSSCYLNPLLLETTIPWKLALDADFEAEKLDSLFMDKNEVIDFSNCLLLSHGKYFSYENGIPLPNGKTWSIEEYFSFLLKTTKEISDFGYEDLVQVVPGFQIIAEDQEALVSLTRSAYYMFMSQHPDLLTNATVENRFSGGVRGAISKEARAKAKKRRAKEKKNKKKVKKRK